VRFTADQLHLAILTQAGCIGLAAGCAAGIASDIQRGRAQAARWATDRQTIDLCTRAYAVHPPGEKLPDPLVEAEADLAAPGMAAAVAFIARTLAIQGTMSFADVVAVVGAHGALIPLSAAPPSAADARAAEDFAPLFGVRLADAVVPDPLPPEVFQVDRFGDEPLVLVMRCHPSGMPAPMLADAIRAALESAGLIHTDFRTRHIHLSAAGWAAALRSVTCPVPPPKPPEFFCE
jgi:hypothetical protein